MAKAKAEKKGNASVKDYGILITPIITEKSSLVGLAGNRIVFRVATEATKTDVRTAVERIFGVDVESVRTVNVLGKVKRTGKSSGRRQSFKKAYVTLAEGQSIDIVEGV